MFQYSVKQMEKKVRNFSSLEYTERNVSQEKMQKERFNVNAG